MARLPVSGSDDGAWGDLLNDFLLQAHTNQGALKAGSVGATQLQANSVGSAQLQAGSVGASQIATDAVTSSAIADGSISELQLDSSLQAKVNAVAPVTSVNNHVGAVTITQTDVGLSNVNNTSDANKPISSATQTALNAKANVSDVGAKVLLINNAQSLPAGTPAGVVVVVKS